MARLEHVPIRWRANFVPFYRSSNTLRATQFLNMHAPSAPISAEPHMDAVSSVRVIFRGVEIGSARVIGVPHLAMKSLSERVSASCQTFLICTFPDAGNVCHLDTKIPLQITDAAMEVAHLIAPDSATCQYCSVFRCEGHDHRSARDRKMFLFCRNCKMFFGKTSTTRGSSASSLSTRR